MAALLIWSLVDVEAPRLITTDYQVINLIINEPGVWLQHISCDNKQRVLDQVNRWKLAVQAGADAIDAYGYAIGGTDYDYCDWLRLEVDIHPQDAHSH